jgi:YD repeat-containing protein
MPRSLFSAVVLLSWGSFAMSAEPPVDEPAVPVVAAPVADRAAVQNHALSRGLLTATDLAHGAGFYQMNMERTWSADLTIDNHFGPGWSDEHVVQIWDLTPQSVVIVRGGRGWRIGRREGEDGPFKVSAKENLTKTPTGWLLEGPGSATLTFDRQGRLLSDRSPFGQIIQYTYDDRSRLTSVGLDPDNNLRYTYDDAADRITRVQGPEGLESRYEYDDAGRLKTVTNSRHVWISYRYNGQGVLTAAEDAFGGRLAVTVPAPVPRAVKPVPRPGYKYNSQGLLVEAQIDGRTVRYTCDESGRLASYESPWVKESYRYDAFGCCVARRGVRRWNGPIPADCRFAGSTMTSSNWPPSSSVPGPNGAIPTTTPGDGARFRRRWDRPSSSAMTRPAGWYGSRATVRCGGSGPTMPMVGCSVRPRPPARPAVSPTTTPAA